MRAVMLLVCSAWVMFNRTKRAVVALIGCVVTPWVLLVTLTTEVKLVPLALTWMLKARVLKLALSPPALACLTTKLVMLKFCPRSTCRNLALAWEHHLSVAPPETLPLKAFAGPSLALHDALPVAGLFSAR